MEFLAQQPIDPLEHSLNVLEFHKILGHIAEKCLSDSARNFILNLKPSTNEESIRIRGELIEEIRQLLAASGQPELAGPSIRRAKREYSLNLNSGK